MEERFSARRAGLISLPRQSVPRVARCRSLACQCACHTGRPGQRYLQTIFSPDKPNSRRDCGQTFSLASVGGTTTQTEFDRSRSPGAVPASFFLPKTLDRPIILTVISAVFTCRRRIVAVKCGSRRVDGHCVTGFPHPAFDGAFIELLPPAAFARHGPWIGIEAPVRSPTDAQQPPESLSPRENWGVDSPSNRLRPPRHGRSGRPHASRARELSQYLPRRPEFRLQQVLS